MGRTGRRKLPWLVLLPLCACTAFARPSGGEAVHLSADGLGPVRIGMTMEQAEHALGTRLRPRAQDASAGCWITRRADGREPGIAYMVVYGQIRRIDLLSEKRQVPAVRSQSGIGIGSTEQATLRAYGGTLSVEPHAYTGADGGRYLKVDAPGKRSGMIFETFDGRVTHIRAGLRPELDYVEGCS